MKDDRQTSADHFDLLPFIAILMCVLGVLLLVTVSMSAVSMGVGAGEAWIPAASANEATRTKHPIIVEWDGKRAVFQFEAGRREAAWTPGNGETIQIAGVTYVLNGKDNDNPEFSAALDLLKEQSDKQYALVAVRPSGFPTMHRFLAEFRRRDITVGYEPIEQERRVKLDETVHVSVREKPTSRP